MIAQILHSIVLYSAAIVWASIYWAVRRLTAWSCEVLKLQDSGLDFSCRLEIFKAPRQQCCRNSCQVLERYDHYNIQSRGFEASRDLAV